MKAIIMHHGAKWQSAKHIVKHFPPHRIYVEPFCGSCSVLFAKEKSFVEIVNDSDDTIVNVFKRLRDDPLTLASKLWAMPYAQKNWSFETDCKAEKAALAIAQAKQFYIGNQSTSTFSIDSTAAAHKPKSDVWSEWHDRVLPAAARLKAVQILNRDAITVIEKFKDRPETLIYVDPPYYGHEKEYRYTVNYSALIAACENAQAKIIVSEFAAGAALWPDYWRRESFETTGRSKTGRHGKAKKNTEFLLFNFDPPTTPPNHEGGITK